MASTSLVLTRASGFTKIASDTQNFKLQSNQNLIVAYTDVDAAPAETAGFFHIPRDSMEIRAGVDGYVWIKVPGEGTALVTVALGEM